MMSKIADAFIHLTCYTNKHESMREAFEGAIL